MELSRTVLGIALAGLVLPDISASASIVVATAFDNSTIKPAGPRTGTSNLNFFNVEGNNNAANASFGVADFHGSSFNFGAPVTSINGAKLMLTESNAAFSAPGSLNIYLSQDNATNIDNTGSPATPNFQAANLPTGIGTQFSPNALVGTGTFTTTGNVNSGQVDTYTLGSLSAADDAYLVNQLNSGGTIRFLIAPADNATAATYAGFGSTSFTGPQLSIDAVAAPEPASIGLLAIGSLSLARRARRR